MIGSFFGLKQEWFRGFSKHSNLTHWPLMLIFQVFQRGSPRQDISWFPEIEVPPHHPFLEGIFHEINHSLLGSTFMDTPISDTCCLVFHVFLISGRKSPPEATEGRDPIGSPARCPRHLLRRWACSTTCHAAGPETLGASWDDPQQLPRSCWIMLASSAGCLSTWSTWSTLYCSCFTFHENNTILKSSVETGWDQHTASRRATRSNCV